MKILLKKSKNESLDIFYSTFGAIDVLMNLIIRYGKAEYDALKIDALTFVYAIFRNVCGAKSNLMAVLKNEGMHYTLLTIGEILKNYSLDDSKAGTQLLSKVCFDFD